MKLGLIRMPDVNPLRGQESTVNAQLGLADSLGFELMYMPKIEPIRFADIKSVQTNHLRIGLDASAFGSMSPRDTEVAIRSVNDALGGQLCLGVQMCHGNSSTKNKADAQNFETLFSHDPHLEKTSSRYPMKPPRPEIIGLPMTGAPQEVATAAIRGYLPLTPSWLGHSEAAHHWPAIVSGATSALRRARPADWQIARSIVIHDDPEVVRSYVFGPRSPLRMHYARLAQDRLISPDIDHHLRKLVIAGSAGKVAEDLLALQEVVGEIGTLHLLDPAGRDPEMTRNTMVRLAEDVMPLITTSDAQSNKELERT
ncbi:MAG: hypothetical protein ABJL99_19910 [Aliishimia sp.]